VKTIDQKGGNTMKYLYTVTSKLNDVYHYYGLYDDVTIHWFCKGRDYPIMHPEEGIKDYHKLKGYERFSARENLNDLFSEEEAKALQDYLSTFKWITMTHITKVDLPLSYNYYCSRDEHITQCYRDAGTLLPEGWDEEVLPFMVAGFYDVGSGVKREPSVCPPCRKEIEAQDPLSADEIPL
jgi:hypothetical protein